ncbi:hypothetical protein B9Z55_018630 [Caenorhabditis nigoni]|uniref:Uncharacterized protein n=2 Tax=Caenorhabditis nigoni TaxID=1611254 RepID=A0A2G5TFR5_9PELO|nr:hypothetical protein B9Z55_018630 [Caenorhabditis nigoni]
MSDTSNLTTSELLFELTTDMELVYFGILVFVFSIFNAPILILIITAKNLKSSVASRRNEIAILFQSTLVTGYISMIIYISHPALFKMFQFIDMNDQTNKALLTFMWIVHCYVNPWMLLVFNKTIRSDCFRILRTGTIDQPPRKARRAVGTSVVTMS